MKRQKRQVTEQRKANVQKSQTVDRPDAGPDFRHQYGIFCGESQTSFTRNATRAGSEEGRLFSQAIKTLKH